MAIGRPGSGQRARAARARAPRRAATVSMSVGRVATAVERVVLRLGASIGASEIVSGSCAAGSGSRSVHPAAR